MAVFRFVLFQRGLNGFTQGLFQNRGRLLCEAGIKQDCASTEVDSITSAFWASNLDFFMTHPSDRPFRYPPSLVLVPPPPTQTAEGSQSHTASPGQEEPASLEQYLDHRARSLSAELEMLSKVRAALEQTNNELQRKMEGWKARESELNQTIGELQATCTSLDNELGSARRQIAQLRQDLQTEPVED